jgi:hypothetical protein
MKFSDFREIARDIITLLTDRILQTIVNDLTKNIIKVWANQAFQKRKIISTIGIILSLISIAINFAFVIVYDKLFANYFRFNLTFANDFRWFYLYNNLPLDDASIPMLNIWKEYIK